MQLRRKALSGRPGPSFHAWLRPQTEVHFGIVMRTKDEIRSFLVRSVELLYIPFFDALYLQAWCHQSTSASKSCRGYLTQGEEKGSTEGVVRLWTICFAAQRRSEQTMAWRHQRPNGKLPSHAQPTFELRRQQVKEYESDFAESCYETSYCKSLNHHKTIPV